MASNTYLSHQALSGVSGASVQLVPENLAANAVNRFFRYDRNTTRLPFTHIELEFETEEERFLFEGGNFQGAFFYNSYPSFLKPYLICSIAGTIFKIEVIGKKGVVSTLFTGNDPLLRHTWFAQGFEWLVIQDGLGLPIVWDGVTPARRADPTKNEVPKGSVMAFIHGRLVVADARGTNEIAVGDIVYGSEQTNTSDVIRFTETQYWAEGGAFGTPIYVGDISGIYPMPYLDTGTGQNELVILGTEGAVSLDLSRPRSEWLNSQLLRISLIGGGCVSSHSLCALNGDLFFRSAEGVRSYRNARAEFAQTWKQSPVSSDVRRWLGFDAPNLLQFNSQVTWNNLLLSTCSPQEAFANNIFAGKHRYHRGFVVMDAEPESSAIRGGAPVWQGMWTGIRPTQFVEGRIQDENRCFAFSYDRDGVNRLYEIEREGVNDIFEGKPVKIYSFYDSPQFGDRNTDKTLEAGEFEFSDAKEEVNVAISVRREDSPCFVEVQSLAAGCGCQPFDCLQFSQPSSDRRIFGGFESKCDPASGKSISRSRYWQMRVELWGDLTVERLAIRVGLPSNGNEKSLNCNNRCVPILCCPHENDYSYHVAPEGENQNIPDIERPSDVPEEVFQAIRSYTARCPNSNISVTRTATASSTISQADAESKALNEAQAAAQSALVCNECIGETLVSFEVQSSTYDLSPFFETGEYLGLAGRPWRLIDGVTLQVYSYGVVDPQGTLSISYALDTGDVTFDPETFVFEDTTGTLVPMYLQVGCPSNGPEIYPPIDDPYA